MWSEHVACAWCLTTGLLILLRLHHHAHQEAMPTKQVSEWIENATAQELTLWVRLVELADALDSASDAQRDAVLDAVWSMIHGEHDWSVWSRAVADWDG